MVRITVARQNRGLRLLVLAALFALPIVFAVLIRRYQTPYRPASVEGSLIFGLIFPALVPLTALLLASGMVQDDVEEQTLTYLLIRPIPRWAIYLAKLAGTVLVSWARSVIFTIGTLVAVYWGQERLMGAVLRDRSLIVAALLGLALSTYSAIFGAMSLWVRRTLVVGAIYIVGFEMIFGSIDFVIRELTVIYYIRVLAVRWLDLSGADWSIDPATAVSAFNLHDRAPRHQLRLLGAGGDHASTPSSSASRRRRGTERSPGDQITRRIAGPGRRTRAGSRGS